MRGDAQRSRCLALALASIAAILPGCGAAPATRSATASPTAVVTSPMMTTPVPMTSPANAYGSLSFTGWLTAADVGPVAPLPFANPSGAVPTVPLGEDAAGRATTGMAAGTQCFHATSADNVDQYEALLVVEVRGRRYRLSIAAEFARAGRIGGEATPPAGGRMTDAGGGDELRFDPEAVLLVDDPMFVASFGDGAVVIAPTLRSGSIDVMLRGQHTSTGAPAPTIHVAGTWTCP